MAARGLISAVAFFCFGQGYRLAEAKRNEPLPSSALRCHGASFRGYLFFGNLPDLATVFGALLIIAGGLYALHVERGLRPTKTTFALLSEEDKA
jgi:drug/metabolite transporter (DMT)-like permease